MQGDVFVNVVFGRVECKELGRGSRSGMHSEVAVGCAARPKKPESDGRRFIGEFLSTVPKMESHYCRANTSKLYQEQVLVELACCCV